MSETGYIYIASPYTHPSGDVRRARFDCVCRFAALVMNRGHIVFSPIAHSHPIALHGLDATSMDFWRRQDKPFLDGCESMVVLMLEGWDESAGVQHEIETVRAAGKPIAYYSPPKATKL